MLVPGTGIGEPIALAEPLSFWGGLDAVSGAVIDRWHPQHGTCLSGRVLLMRSGRGSSSGSSVLAEAIRRGTGPAAIVLAERDAIIAVGAMVARELYGSECPVVVVPPAELETLAKAGSALRVFAAEDGGAVIEKRKAGGDEKPRRP